jgi:hypothetical protein
MKDLSRPGAYGVGEYLVEVGVHCDTLPVWRGLETIPIAQGLKRIVEQY